MTIPEETLRSRLESRQQRLEERLSKIEETSQTNGTETHPGVYHKIAEAAAGLGTLQYCLGEQTTAQSTCKVAAEHFINTVRSTREQLEELTIGYWLNEPQMLRYAQHHALLSGDDELIEAAAAETYAMDSVFVEKFPDDTHKYHTAVAVAGTITDDNDTVTEHAKQLREELSTLPSEQRSHFRGIATAAEGINRADRSTVTAGLETLLTHHDARSESELKQTRNLICQPAAALLVIARRNDLEIELDSPYLPAGLPES